MIAAGGGSFMPKKPPLANIEAYEGESVFYAVRKIEAFRRTRVVIVGGGDSALDWTLNLHSVAERVTLLHHRDGFRAAPHSVARMKQLAAAGEIDFIVGKLSALVGEAPRLSGVSVVTAEGDKLLSANRFLAFFGLTMKLGPIAQFGLNFWEMSSRLTPGNSKLRCRAFSRSATSTIIPVSSNSFSPASMRRH